MLVTYNTLDDVYGSIRYMEQIGKGSSSKVYEGMDNNTKVAIKIRNRYHMRQLENELIIASELEDVSSVVLPLRVLFHTSYLDEEICKTFPHKFGFFSDDTIMNTYFIIYELMDNTLSQQDISKMDVVETIMCQLLLGLTEIHNRCIIHRDIKPQNIMMKNGRPKYIDFDLSEKVSTKTTKMKGTLLYMPPELFKNDLPQDWYKIDVFSLGVTFHWLCTGTTLYDTELNREDLLKYIYKTKHSILIKRVKKNLIDIQWSDLIIDMIHPDHKLRYDLCMCLKYFDIELSSTKAS